MLFNLTRLPLVFSKFFPGCLHFFQVFKNTHLLVYFQFKVKFKVKNYFNKYKILKRYCKATLNVFFNKKIFDDD